MEPNNQTQELIPNPYSQQPAKQKGFFLPVIGIVLLLIIVITGSYYLGTQKNQSRPKSVQETMNYIPTPSSTPTSYPSPTPIPSVETDNWKVYTNSSEFAFKYPSDWAITPNTYKYDYVSLRSPDYSVNTEGIETLDKGVELMIYTETTTEKSIDKKFEQDRFAGQIANSKTYTTVDGQKAIQYDYSYENTQATDTIFIQNLTDSVGMHYLIKLRYADSNAKSKYWSTYLSILKSFEGL